VGVLGGKFPLTSSFRRKARLKHCLPAHISLTTVAQIFGGKGVDSRKKYITLDSIHLKECAPIFAGIEPKGTGTRQSEFRRYLSAQ